MRDLIYDMKTPDSDRLPIDDLPKKMREQVQNLMKNLFESAGLVICGEDSEVLRVMKEVNVPPGPAWGTIPSGGGGGMMLSINSSHIYLFAYWSKNENPIDNGYAFMRVDSKPFRELFKQQPQAITCYLSAMIYALGFDGVKDLKTLKPF